jgi:hypothetical protein
LLKETGSQGFVTDTGPVKEGVRDMVKKLLMHFENCAEEMRIDDGHGLSPFVRALFERS